MSLDVLSVLVSPGAGGAEYAAVDLLDALARRGARARLLTNHPELVAGTMVQASPIELGPKLNRASLVRHAMTAPLMRQALRRALAEQAPFDVLLVHFKKEQLLAATLPASVTGPVVWAEWGPIPRQLRRGPARQVYARAASRAAAVLAESEATAASMTGAGVSAAKVSVIGNVFDDLRPAVALDLGVPAGTFVAGCVSRLHPSKPLDVVIGALAHLPPDVVLVLAGDGEDEQRLRGLAAPYGDRVRFLGTPRGRVGELLAAFDVLVYAPSASEGAARGVTLGQLAARPILATAVEGTIGLLSAGTGSVAAPADDPAALAALIGAYRDDPDRRAREGAAGRAAALERLARLDPVTTAWRVLRAARASTLTP